MTAPAPNPTDEELARQARAGSLVAFDELVARFEVRLFRFLVQGTRNETDAAELTQDTLVTAYQKLAGYDPARSFATWVFTIARRKQIDFFRHHGVRRDHALGITADDLVDEADPGRLAEQAEERDRVWDCARASLAELPFQALWLKYNEDLSVEQIAAVLGRTTIHVKVILFRARATLATALARWERAADSGRPAVPAAPPITARRMAPPALTL